MGGNTLFQSEISIIDRYVFYLCVAHIIMEVCVVIMFDEYNKLEIHVVTMIITCFRSYLGDVSWSDVYIGVCCYSAY